MEDFPHSLEYKGGMALNSLFMGVDIGTSSVKAALFDREGKQVSLYHKEYPLICNEDGMAEIDPDKILGSLLVVIKTCVEKAGVNKNNIEAMDKTQAVYCSPGFCIPSR